MRFSLTGCSSSLPKYQRRCASPYRSSSVRSAWRATRRAARSRSASSVCLGASSEINEMSPSSSDASVKSSTDWISNGSIATSISRRRKET